MITYDIQNSKGLPNSQPIMIDKYPWYKEGRKQKTFVAMSYTKASIKLYVHCEDKYARAKYNNYGDPVYKDSCFEWFFSPQSDGRYINIEINCLGTLYMAYGSKDVANRRLVDYEVAKTVQIKSSYDPLCLAKDYWDLEVIVPLRTIESIIGKRVEFGTWDGNFYRCGGAVEPQYASWTNIQHPVPNYHLPDYFGKLHFI